MHRSHILSDEQKIQLVKDYQTGLYNCKQLGQKYSITSSGIRSLLIRRKVYNKYDRAKYTRKVAVNEHFFDVIDTEEKAYFLGLLYADGCNDYHIDKGSVLLYLQAEDDYILREFCQCLDYDYVLRYRRPRKSHHKQQTVLKIHSKIMSARLNELGCVPRKSLILEYPNHEQVPESLMHHFVRGYFDGDGSIYECNNVIDVKVTSSAIFCNGLQRYLSRLEIPCSVELHPNPKTASVRFTSKESRMLFLRWIYQNANYFLTRKHDKYLGYMANYDPDYRDHLYISQKGYPVIGCNISTGEICRFKSYTEASNNGFPRSSVCASCKGLIRSTNGWIFIKESDFTIDVLKARIDKCKQECPVFFTKNQRVNDAFGIAIRDETDMSHLEQSEGIPNKITEDVA